MERLPNDLQAEQRLLADISRYCGLVHEANGSYPGSLLAVADFMIAQFNFTHDEATRFVTSSGLFSEQDSSSVINDKSALAPLLLTDDLIQMQVMLRFDFHEGDQVGLLDRWYGNLASTALGMAGSAGHSVEDCCADSVTDSHLQSDVACIVSDDCVLRTTRQFLLRPALRPNTAAITDESDMLLQYSIVTAKLSAALDCEFITAEQKEALVTSYTKRMQTLGRE